MSIHHKLGMSKWTPWSVCPKFDSVTHSTSASIGSAQHDKLARLLNGDDTLELDETEMIDRAVKWAAQIIKGDAIDETLYTEEMVEISDRISENLAGIYGTVDAFFIQHITDKETGDERKVSHIFDSKSMARGMGNDLFPQLMGYALGVASLLGVTEMNTEVVLHVLLGGAFRHVIKQTDLFDCLTTGETVVNKRKHCESAKPCPSEWCRYCRHSTSCEATDEQVELVRQGVLNSMSVPKRLVFIEQVEAILAKAKAEAKAEIANAEGKTVTDDGITYAIHPVNGPSKLGDGKMWELYSMLTSKGVSLEDLFSKCTVKKGDAMKLLQATGMKLKSKDPAVETAETCVSPYYEATTVEKLERID